MEFLTYWRKGNWWALFGYALFTGMMTVGYTYNLTFVQLGLVDLGERLVGLSPATVARDMAVLALLTCALALAWGTWMSRQSWTRPVQTKLQLSFCVIALQTVLTAVAPYIRSEQFYMAWIAGASVGLGVGVPVTFSLTVDLVPARDRGYVAALVTALAYLAANIFFPDWSIEAFTRQILLVMLPGLVALGVLAFYRWPFYPVLAAQPGRVAFGCGRWLQGQDFGSTNFSQRLRLLVLLMFGAYFVDSLGFLRLLDTPVYMNTSWQSPNPQVRLFIGVIHVVTALIAGVLYSNLDIRHLFLWIFGIFALVHLAYSFSSQFLPGMPPSLGNPMLYAAAVSLYTVVNFAIWADLSTPRTISRNAALGVAFSGWTATFISTALSIQWRGAGMSLPAHLRVVDALAMLFFLAVVMILLWGNPPEGLNSKDSEEKFLS